MTFDNFTITIFSLTIIFITKLSKLKPFLFLSAMKKKGVKSSAAVNTSNNDDDDNDVDGDSKTRTKKVFAADPSEIFDGECLPTTLK